MAGTSSINLKGTVDIATARRNSEIALVQIVGDIEVKQFEVRIPVSQASPLAITLPFSTGVAEALVLSLYSPYKLILEMTFTDTANGGATDGPVRRGFKGHLFDTFSPGEGLKTLGVINPSADNEATLEVMLGTVEAAGEIPEFWA